MKRIVIRRKSSASVSPESSPSVSPASSVSPSSSSPTPVRPLLKRRKLPPAEIFDLPVSPSKRPLQAGLSSALSVAFQPLKGGWQSFIRFVEIASREEPEDGTGDMTRLLTCYNSIPKRERRSVTPEDLCESAGVSIRSLLSSIMPWIWIYSNSAAGVIAAASNPAVLAKTARSALGMSKHSAKDRETFLKVTGALPTAKGSQTVINNIPIAGAVSSSSGAPIRLPSAGQDVMQLDRIDDIQEEDADDVDDADDVESLESSEFSGGSADVSPEVHRT